MLVSACAAVTPWDHPCPSLLLLCPWMTVVLLLQSLLPGYVSGRHHLSVSGGWSSPAELQSMALLRQWYPGELCLWGGLRRSEHWGMGREAPPGPAP